MSYLNKLKIVAQAAKRQQTRSERRRGKLLEKLEDQLAMIGFGGIHQRTKRPFGYSRQSD